MKKFYSEYFTRMSKIMFGLLDYMKDYTKLDSNVCKVVNESFFEAVPTEEKIEQIVKNYFIPIFLETYKKKLQEFRDNPKTKRKDKETCSELLHILADNELPEKLKGY